MSNTKTETTVTVQSFKYDKKELNKLPTKSAKVRYLATLFNHDHDENNVTGKIAKILSDEYGKNVRYQHVRNVLITPLKRK